MGLVLLAVVLSVLASSLAFAPASGVGNASGPLRVHPDNPRYLADADGRAVLLTGFHTWNSLQDMGPGDPPEPFDYDGYLDLLQERGANYIRLWRWEMPKYHYPQDMYPSQAPYLHSAPHPWLRSGADPARDGKPKFDLTQFDANYFERLRDRVARAGRRGIYVSVMLFEGHCAQYSEEGWEFHPFATGNNVNGIDADADGDGRGLEFYTLQVPEVTRMQEAYVRHVVDAVNDLDNVFYEISNEAGGYSTEWQYHMIRHVKEYEAGKPWQHLVGMTFQYRGGRNADLFASPAAWISPNPDGGYRDAPPAADGSKVILSDTDHLWGVGGNRAWIWQTFTQGMHPVFMDPWGRGYTLFKTMDAASLKDIRSNLGYVQRYPARMNLAAAFPHGELASSGYCLANPGVEYLVYLPEGGEVEVDLSAAAGELSAEWFRPDRGEPVSSTGVPGAERRTFTAPFDGDAVLYLRAR